MSHLIITIDLYLAHASTAGLITWASLGILTVGLGPFALAEVIAHISAVRSGEA